MLFNGKATCDFHAEIPHQHLLSTLGKRAVILDSRLTGDRIASALKSYDLDLLQDIPDFQDIVVCAGCWAQILSGKANSPLIFPVSFLHIESVDKEGYVRLL